MELTVAASALRFGSLVSSLPGGVAQGLIWGIMALGVYITFRLLDVADLSVDVQLTTRGTIETCIACDDVVLGPEMLSRAHRW